MAAQPQNPEQQPAAPPYQEMELDSQQKLEALRDDPHAGFLATQRRETNQGVELLSYIPDRINDRLTEIFYRQQREGQGAGLSAKDAWGMALVSVESVVNELGDYQADALKSLTQLYPLQKAVEDCPSPTVKLASLLEDMEATAPDPRYLVRYVDLLALREKGVYPGFDPLVAGEDRRLNDPNRNKRVHDVYTSPGQANLLVEAHIGAVAEELTVRELRGFVPAAVEDSSRRAQFWYKVLQSVNDDKEGFARYAREVEVRVAREAMKKV